MRKRKTWLSSQLTLLQVDFGVPLFMEPKTAVLFAQCMAEKIPQRVPGEIPAEVRRWSEFIGGKPL